MTLNPRAAVAVLWLTNPGSRIVVESAGDGRWYWFCGLCGCYDDNPETDTFPGELAIGDWRGVYSTWRWAYTHACRHRERHRKQLADMFKETA